MKTSPTFTYEGKRGLQDTKKTDPKKKSLHIIIRTLNIKADLSEIHPTFSGIHESQKVRY